MRKLTGAVVVSAFALGLAGCGGSSNTAASPGSSSARGSSAATAANLTPLKVAAFGTPSVLYSGLAAGKFDKDKPEVSTIDSGPPALPLMQSGKLDAIVDVGGPPIAIALARNIPVKVVWVTSLSHNRLVGGKNVKSIADLKGKKVATAVGSITDFLLDAYLAKNGLKPTDIQKVDLPPPSMPAALQSGQIDAAYTWPPFNSVMASAPGNTVLEEKDDIASVIVSPGAVAKHSAAVQQLVCGLAASSQDFMSNTAAAQAAVATAIKQPLDAVQALMPVSVVGPPDQSGEKWLGSAGQPSALSAEVEQVGVWLVGQKRIGTAPSASAVEAAFDRTFAAKAASGGCS